MGHTLYRHVPQPCHLAFHSLTSRPHLLTSCRQHTPRHCTTHDGIPRVLLLPEVHEGAVKGTEQTAPHTKVAYMWSVQSLYTCQTKGWSSQPVLVLLLRQACCVQGCSGQRAARSSLSRELPMQLPEWCVAVKQACMHPVATPPNTGARIFMADRPSLSRMPCAGVVVRRKVVETTCQGTQPQGTTGTMDNTL